MEDHPDRRKEDEDEEKKQGHSKDQSNDEDKEEDNDSLSDQITGLTIDDVQQAIKRAFMKYKDGLDPNTKFDDFFGDVINRASTYSTESLRNPTSANEPQDTSRDPTYMPSTSGQSAPVMPIRYQDSDPSSGDTRPVDQSVHRYGEADRGMPGYEGDCRPHHTHSETSERTDNAPKYTPEEAPEDSLSTPRKRSRSESDVPDCMTPSKRAYRVDPVEGTESMVEMKFKFGDYFVTPEESDTQDTPGERPRSSSDPSIPILPSDANKRGGGKRRSREQYESEQGPSEPNPRGGKWNKTYDLFYKKIRKGQGPEQGPRPEGPKPALPDPTHRPVYVDRMEDNPIENVSTPESLKSTPSPPISPQEQRYQFQTPALALELDVSTSSGCKTVSSVNGQCTHPTCKAFGSRVTCNHRTFSSGLGSMESGGIQDPASSSNSSDSGIGQGGVNPDNGGNMFAMPGPSGKQRPEAGASDGSVRPKMSPQKVISRRGRVPSLEGKPPMNPWQRRESAENSSPEIPQGNKVPVNQGPVNQGPGNQGPGNQGPENQGPGNGGLGNRGLGNQGPGIQGPGNQGMYNPILMAPVQDTPPDSPGFLPPHMAAAAQDTPPESPPVGVLYIHDEEDVADPAPAQDVNGINNANNMVVNVNYPSSNDQNPDYPCPNVSNPDYPHPNEFYTQRVLQENRDNLVESMDEQQPPNPNPVKRVPRDHDDDFHSDKPQGPDQQI